MRQTRQLVLLTLSIESHDAEEVKGVSKSNENPSFIGASK